MSEHSIVLPSKPKIVSEKDNRGVYEIDGFYPGYGFTIGNSLRRVILSSLPEFIVTITSVELPPSKTGIFSGLILIISMLVFIEISVIFFCPVFLRSPHFHCLLLRFLPARKNPRILFLKKHQ